MALDKLRAKGLTKGAKALVEEYLYVLTDAAGGFVAVYNDEDLAYAACDVAFELTRAELDVSRVFLNEDLSLYY